MIGCVTATTPKSRARIVRSPLALAEPMNQALASVLEQPLDLAPR